jgi:hypothetical protein
MIIQVGTCDVGKLHEEIQAHLIIPNIALAAQVLTILLPLCWYLVIINFYRHCFFVVDSGDRSHFRIVMIL